jgi:2-aminoadipate transaminase
MKCTAVRELLKVTARPEIISFAGGLPAAELFPVARVKAAADAVLDRLGGQCLQYAETEGIGELRDWVARRYSTDQLRLARGNVLITCGAQQALDLIGRVLLEEGDRVVVENPTYLALLSAWRPQEVEFVPAPSDDAGLVVETLELVLEQCPKLIYLVPNFQNPQGTTLSGPRREQLAALLREYDVPLIEDDPYGELRYEGEALPHLLELDRVIHTGTFSKVLMPGLRVGWVIAAPAVIEKFVQAKQAADLHTSTLSQWIALELVRSDFLDEHLPVLRRAYRERRDVMLEALERHFAPLGASVTWTRPAGGMFLMVTLPPEMNANVLLAQALDRQVAFVPGEEFHLQGAGKNTLRLNFSNAKPAQIETGIARLAALVKDK